MTKIDKTEQQWREQLSDEQYRVMREKGTEAPFSGEYDQCDDAGVYHCAACGAELFNSADKFNAGCGWPSFSKTKSAAALDEQADNSLPDRPRTEVLCHQCDAHLGHVFDDGPESTGLRYCINSVALDLERKEES